MDIADTATPPAQQGEWTLTAPDGRQWKALTPLSCVSKEMRERVPADVALARIMREINADCICKAHPKHGFWLSIECPVHGNRYDRAAEQGSPATTGGDSNG